MHTIPLIHSCAGRLHAYEDCRHFITIVMKRFGSGRACALNLFRKLAFAKLMSELKWIVRIPSFGARFEPRYIFRAGRLDQ